MSLFDGFEHIVSENESMAQFTWFRLGGPARYFAEPTSVDELGALVRHCHDREIRARLLGGGSNLLVRDEGVDGVVIHLSAAAFSDIQVRERTIIAGGGAKLGHVISTSVREGLAGLEQLVGIPGTVGGALHGNSGTHGGDIGLWTTASTVMTKTGDILTRNKDDLRFSYRSSSLDELVILSGEFQLEQEDARELTKRMQKLWIVEKANQPMSGESTGCMFKSSGGESAGEVIDQAGLKGARVGEAEVSDRNANFILAGPGATADDILKLMDLIRTGVSERLGIELEPEIEVW